MKRSEAIKLISNFIYELNVDSEDCDVVSDKILKALEDAGIEPPDNNHYNSEYGEWRYWEDEDKNEISD